MLQHLGLERLHVRRAPVGGRPTGSSRTTVTSFYPLPILHRRSDHTDDKTVRTIRGVRTAQHPARPAICCRCGGRAEDEWPTAKMVGGVWTISPHVSIAGFVVNDEKLFMISQLFPGDTPTTSITVQSFLASVDPPRPTISWR